MSGPGATPAILKTRAVQISRRLDVIVIQYPRVRYAGTCRALRAACLLSTPPLIAIIAVALAACAPIEPQRPPEVRTQIVEVKTIVPVPCFTEAERPVLAPPTPINIDTATVDQMAAAIAADDLADQLFAKAVDALFVLCMKRIADGTATQPVGAK